MSTVEILAERVSTLEKQLAALLKSTDSPDSPKEKAKKDKKEKKEKKEKSDSDEEKPKNTEIMCELAKRWKAIDDDEREVWNTKAKELKDSGEC